MSGQYQNVIDNYRRMFRDKYKHECGASDLNILTWWREFSDLDAEEQDNAVLQEMGDWQEQ